MLQQMKTNLIEVLDKRQTSKIIKNISLQKKKLDQLRELQDIAQELMLKEKDAVKVNKWDKELESKLVS